MSADQPKPTVSRPRGLPLIWIVPFVALVVGGWMVAQEYLQRGPEVEILFLDAAGVQPGSTKLEHKGVTVGQVTDVRIAKDLEHVVVRLQLNGDVAALAAEGSQFWIVHPKIGFSGVSGLDTLVSGVRLNVRPGDGPTAERFVGLNQAPPPLNEKLGRAIFLESPKLGAISPGAPVYYREVKVGQVETSALAEDATKVIARVRIEDRYVDLVRTSSRFWNAGGLNVKVGLLGAEIKSTSVESLFSGGVSFATPEPADGKELAPVAEEGRHFMLESKVDEKWEEWAPVIPIHPQQASPDTKPDPPLQQMMSGGA